ncbi:unnamed protein product [Acanthoscelides obtectus]|uniref:Uncharacterized protein n=1 Tax=Acanthoscelides obtectus TaxID=200917 RepID=A0A9P0LU60_ACAOB|nr:unnamed protein product [Acanthoscelides obtectus]CAK1638592.1 hypothetical protein AOBTE_LOCUS10689 [Acanthoscelides obtectus]
MGVQKGEEDEAIYPPLVAKFSKSNTESSSTSSRSAFKFSLAAYSLGKQSMTFVIPCSLWKSCKMLPSSTCGLPKLKFCGLAWPSSARIDVKLASMTADADPMAVMYFYDSLKNKIKLDFLKIINFFTGIILKLNFNKTYLITFSSDKRFSPVDKFQIQTSDGYKYIQAVNNIKYLAIIIDDNLNWNINDENLVKN